MLRRQIITSPDLNDYLYRDWVEVGQVFRFQRERTSRDKSSTEVVYGWTSLSREQCSPQRPLQVTREQWTVENRLHWRRDVMLGEDRCGVHFPPVAQMLAVLNSAYRMNKGKSRIRDYWMIDRRHGIIRPCRRADGL